LKVCVLENLVGCGLENLKDCKQINKMYHFKTIMDMNKNDEQMPADAAEKQKELDELEALGIPISTPCRYVPSRERGIGIIPQAEQQVSNETEAAVRALQTPQAAVPLVKPTRKQRKESHGDYKETYFKRIDFSNRQPLYITRATHEKLMLIVNVIGGRKATISSYVENILLHHLEHYLGCKKVSSLVLRQTHLNKIKQTLRDFSTNWDNR
jgi:hypothetical protein